MSDSMYSVSLLKEKANAIIQLVKQRGASAGEVSVSEERGFAVTARGRLVDKLEYHQEKHLGITVYFGERSGNASTTDFSQQAIDQVVEKACSLAQWAEPDPFSGLADAEDMASDYPDLDLYHPWKISPQEGIDLAVRCEEMSVQKDARVKPAVEGSDLSTYEFTRVYANTHGFVGGYQGTMHRMNSMIVAEENDCRERDYEYSVARDAKNLLSPEEIATQAVMKTVRRLGSRNIQTQRCPVIFHATEAKGLVGAFISAISGSSLYRRNSFLVDSLDQDIFPNFVSIRQDPWLKGGYGSSPFDDQGVRTRPMDYVAEGKLVNYILGAYSARKLGMKTTGNAGGVYNLMIDTSQLSLQQMLKEMGRGVLVMEQMGQGVNIVTGDYSRGAFGFWVEHGEIQYPISEFTLAGNLKEMFMGIQAIGNDVDHRTNVKTGSIWINEMTLAGEG